MFPAESSSPHRLSLASFPPLHLTFYATDTYIVEDVLIYKLQEMSCTPPFVTTLDRMLFVVMCSSDNEERVS
jgi:hypothetical protein